MGISLKDITNPKDDEIAFNRQEKLLRKLKLLAILVFILILIIGIIAFAYKSKIEQQNNRIKLLATDMGNISTKILVIGSEYQKDPATTPLLGESLRDNPYVFNVNGNEEEYRYGYYLIGPEILSQIMTLNLPNEWYLVNYSTGDVVNYYGVQRRSRVYYSLLDIKALAENKTPISDTAINIRNASDMQKIRNNPSGHFRLSNNIDMSQYSTGDGWAPVENFTGYFDGRDYTISNLTVATPSKTYTGLFAEIKSSGYITNVKFENATIKGGEYTGVLAGYCSGNVRFCEVSGANIEGQSHTGGLVGAYDKGVMRSCYVSNVSIAGTDAIGGLIGTLYSGTIEKCYAKGNVAGVQAIGGLIGRTKSNETTYVRQSYADTLINARSNAGGFIGDIESLSANVLEISDCYSKGAIQGGESNCGGFVGNMYIMNGARINLNSLYTTTRVLPSVVGKGGFAGNVYVAVGGGVNPVRVMWEKDPLGDIGLNGIGTITDQGVGFTFDAKTPQEMRRLVTYGNWNLDIWAINENVDTAYLKWQTQDIK